MWGIFLIAFDWVDGLHLLMLCYYCYSRKTFSF